VGPGEKNASVVAMATSTFSFASGRVNLLPAHTNSAATAAAGNKGPFQFY
jgi:hypothetical protein